MSLLFSFFVKDVKTGERRADDRRNLKPRFSVAKIFIVGIILMAAAKIAFAHTISYNLRHAIMIYALYAGMGAAIGIFYQALMPKLVSKDVLARAATVRTSLYSIAAGAGALAGGALGAALGGVDLLAVPSSRGLRI